MQARTHAGHSDAWPSAAPLSSKAVIISTVMRPAQLQVVLFARAPLVPTSLLPYHTDPFRPFQNPADQSTHVLPACSGS